MNKHNVSSVVGIDLAKTVFQLCGKDAHGVTGLRKRVRRAQLFHTVAQLPPCRVAMEACGGAHYWGRRFAEGGHEVVLLPPGFVRAFRQGGKNDAADAEAIAEAAMRAEAPRVAVKSVVQQAVLALHRMRSACVKRRTALINQMRGLLAEFGVTLPKGRQRFQRELPQALSTPEVPWSGTLTSAFEAQRQVLTALDRQITDLEAQLGTFCKTEEAARLMEVPGVGPLTATAFSATLGDPAHFRNARQVPAWLGITPRQHSSGERRRLLGISKHGDAYLRTLLIHGARSYLRVAHRHRDRRSRWLLDLEQRAGTNKAGVALANKNARVLWALLAHGDTWRCEI